MITNQPTLSEREWSLVMQLLEAERRDLPVELRHTTSQSYSEALDERRNVVEDLIRRLQASGVSVS